MRAKGRSRRNVLVGLKVLLLGPPQIEHDGGLIQIERRKATALLAYLVATGSSHSRDALAALLWPEADPQRAYAYLRNAIWILNRLPIGDWLIAERHLVGLRSAGLWVDIRRFRQLASSCPSGHHDPGEACARCVPALTEAADLYRDHFMAGFAVDDSASFEEWQFVEADVLRQELARVLDRLILFHEDRGAYETAIPCARRWVSLDALNESVHQRLMTLYALSGRRADALRQYEACERILHEELTLKPTDETTALVERIRMGEVAGIRPPPQRPRSRHTLPTPPTPFVGRGDELTGIRGLLANPDCRMVTIVGLGGSGKTRLAVRAAETQVDAFPDGVFFVPLAPVTAPEFLAPAIADAMEAPIAHRDVDTHARKAHDSQAAEARLISFLSEQRVLLLLDNMEHLLAGTAFLAEILRRAPTVTLLATSRERLNLQGEWVVEIVGLEVPEKAAPSNAIGACAAVQLFVEASQRARTRFTPNEEDLHATARVVRLLDGIPLAIELAAAWTKVLSIPRIADEIERGLDFLASPHRDVEPRHASLRAAFDQSWRLLSKEGRAAFRKLAVFHGGFTREAAREVADAELTALASLVDKSLLRRTEADRYEMHELLRQYAQERLQAVPREREVVKRRHAEHYLAVVAAQERGFKGANQRAALDLLTREIDNVRAAWQWAVPHRMFAALRRAAMGMFLYYDIRSRFQEPTELFEAAAEASGGGACDEATVRLHALMRAFQGWFLRVSRPVDSEDLIAGALRSLETGTHGEETAFVTLLAGFSRFPRSDGGDERLSTSLAFYEASGDEWGTATSLEALASTAYPVDPASAAAYARGSLVIRKRCEDRWGRSMAEYSLGMSHLALDDLRIAERHIRQALKLRRELGEDPYGMVGSLLILGWIELRLGRPEEARKLLDEGLTLARRIVSPRSIGSALGGLARWHFETGDLDAAASLAGQSLAVYRRIGSDDAISCSLAMQARIALARADESGAAQHLEEGLQHHSSHPGVLLGLGMLSERRGEAPDALVAFVRAATEGAVRYDHSLVLEALIGVARLAIRSGNHRRAAEILEAVRRKEGVLPRLRQEASRLTEELRAVPDAASILEATGQEDSRPQEVAVLVQALLQDVRPPPE